ncbi:MAG: membrane protein insertase YidC [Actinomycetota bacterium]
MIAIGVWQTLLDSIGWLLARIYDFIPNYGLSIIALTVLTRLVLLPLGIKQIRSMQNMQAIQPKVKAIQQKYKGNRQKQNEEVMKVYQEAGVNPLSGCWPMLLQLPILVTFYSVLRYPQSPPHLPTGSELRLTIDQQIAPSNAPPASGLTVGGVNLMCSAQQAGTPSAELKDKSGKIVGTIDCGQGVPTKIPYYILAAAMVATTFFQQRQMQRASPPGANQQQQMLTRVMPLLFGFWGFFFPAGLVLYWTTANLIQIGQQRLLLRAAHIDDTTPALAPPKKPARRGLFASMMERAESERSRRDGGSARPNAKGGPRKPSPGKPSSGEKRPARESGPKGTSAPNSKGRSGRSSDPTGVPRASSAGQDDGTAETGDGIDATDGNEPRKSTGAGGNGAGDRKKRRKR